MDFEKALIALKLGHRVARAGWNGKGMFVFLTEAWHAGDIAGRPFVAMKTAQGDLVPWLCSQTDMLAEDWTFVAP